MTLRTSFFATCALALTLGTAAPAATVFSDGATDPTGTGRGVGSFTVGFSATGGTNAISFDLFGIDSVDGYGNGYDDVFTVLLNGVAVFEGLFNMSGGGSNRVTLNTLGWAWNTVTNPGGNFQGGNTHVSGQASLLSGLNYFTVLFSSPGPSNGTNQGVGDESWALNNLDVTPAVAPVPLPGALPLMAVALGALALGRRRKA